MDLITSAADAATHPIGLVQVESSCYPLAEAGDLLRIRWGAEFVGAGVYALAYDFTDGRTWSGLRELRAVDGVVEVGEGASWSPITPVARILGRVEGSHRSRADLEELLDLG